MIPHQSKKAASPTLRRCVACGLGKHKCDFRDNPYTHDRVNPACAECETEDQSERRVDHVRAALMSGLIRRLGARQAWTPKAARAVKEAA